jgi:hypothetical protein
VVLLGRESTIHVRARLANCWSRPVWIRTAWPPYVTEMTYRYVCGDAAHPDGHGHWGLGADIGGRDYVYLEDSVVSIAPGGQHEMAVGLAVPYDGEAWVIGVPFEVGPTKDGLVEITVEATVILHRGVDVSHLLRPTEPDAAP